MSSEAPVRARVWVTGKVQGVGYRAFAQRAASHLGLSGGVRNLDDGRVEVDVEGDRPRLEQFIERLRSGPSGGRVQHVDVRWEPAVGRTAGFEIWA
jgi:acylphosphatase